ncbi:thioredoxin fold domain-containing protein [Chitinophaga sp. G-6-1-13]|uniref:Thioredoxin fold domain-containing protein n=1 Tax=Chitinophaga fulva TaxID=2728842 RepID=A0A848GHT5_9BACT|nr:thioredoxin fold domain-containing protein [Chitinophaga fulva]NML36622.1 thioredoxin fold domain-containing protein [Chitinophaga fulva]
MKKILSMLCLLVALKGMAQEEIAFNNATWQASLDQATKENKLIFLDCYTSWCGPCKWMEKNVFNVPEVFNYYNQHFINTKHDMEKGEGVDLRKKYNIQSFPTYLFINGKGEVVHRTGSRMSVEEFLEEAHMATDPNRNMSSLSARYNAGERSVPFLLNYYLAVYKSDRRMAAKIGEEITTAIPEQDLSTPLGWKVIKHIAQSGNDRLGKYYLANQTQFASYAGQEERDALTDRLISSTLYPKIYNNDEKGFFEGLPHFKQSKMPERQRQAVMLEAEWYFQRGNLKEYVKLTDAAMKGVLKADAEKLSFLARRINGKRDVDAKTTPFLPQAYKMAKKAAALDPEEYSVQSTFGWVCLSMKKKEEGLTAARKARALADAETSKIQKLAQELVDQLEKL